MKSKTKTTATTATESFRSCKVAELSELLDQFKVTASIAEVMVMLEVLRAREGCADPNPDKSGCPIVEVFTWAYLS